MTSVLPVRLGYKQKTPRMWGTIYKNNFNNLLKIILFFK